MMTATRLEGATATATAMVMVAMVGVMATAMEGAAAMQR